jgi:hypothetical protein
LLLSAIVLLTFSVAPTTATLVSSDAAINGPFWRCYAQTVRALKSDAVRFNAVPVSTHIGSWPQRMLGYVAAVSPTRSQTVCESAAGDGVSAALFLCASRTSRVYSWADTTDAETERVHKHLTALFPRRFVSTRGAPDSAVTSPTDALQDRPCDIVSVDGEQTEEGVLRDLAAFGAVSHGSTVILVNNVGCDAQQCQGVSAAWDAALISRGIIDQGCIVDEGRNRGWCKAKFSL